MIWAPTFIATFEILKVMGKHEDEKMTGSSGFMAYFFTMSDIKSRGHPQPFWPNNLHSIERDMGETVLSQTKGRLTDCLEVCVCVRAMS